VTEHWPDTFVVQELALGVPAPNPVNDTESPVAAGLRVAVQIVPAPTSTELEEQLTDTTGARLNASPTMTQLAPLLPIVKKGEYVPVKETIWYSSADV